MQKKLILALGTSCLITCTSVAQIKISDETYNNEKKDCASSIQSVYKVELENSYVYLNYDKATPKGHFNIFVKDNETCSEKKMSHTLPSFLALPYNIQFESSPKKKVAIAIEKDGVYAKKAFHAIDGEGNLLWSQNWDLKSGDFTLQVLNADIDDVGNASFFVKADQKKQGNAYAFVYRNVDDGKLKVIGYALDVNGRVTFRNKFDEWGNIHFMGAFEKTDAKETGDVKRGIFHGKVNPKESDKLETSLYSFKETKKYDSDWKLKDYAIDEEGNITLCAFGQYKKGGAGRDFTKIFILQLDESGKEKWSHLITTINLMKESYTFGEGEFHKLGNNYAYIYYDNAGYAQYTTGIDVENISSEPKQDDIQMYVVDTEGKLNKYSIAPRNYFGKNGSFKIVEAEDAIYLKNDKASKKITW